MDIARLEREMLGDLWVSTDLWENLSYLCDACNGRFAGTEDEHRAGDFMGSQTLRLSPLRCAVGTAGQPC
jgi:hypothetical protein